MDGFELRGLTLEEIKESYPDQYVKALENTLAAKDAELAELKREREEQLSALSNVPELVCGEGARHIMDQYRHKCIYCVVDKLTAELVKAQASLQAQYRKIRALEEKIVDKDAELAELRGWKESALLVEKGWDIQAVAKLINVPLGESIRANIEPEIRRLLTELAEEKKAQETLAVAVLGQEGYDNSPCQAHPYELIAYSFEKLKKELTKARATYRCFHCGFETSDKEQAEAHFGEGEGESAICVEWARLSEDDRLRAYQETIIELNKERDEHTKTRAEVERLTCISKIDRNYIRGLDNEIALLRKQCDSCPENFQTILKENEALRKRCEEAEVHAATSDFTSSEWKNDYDEIKPLVSRAIEIIEQFVPGSREEDQEYKTWLEDAKQVLKEATHD